MRVLHVVTALSVGGAERLVRELCRRRADDVDVEVFAVLGGGELEAGFAGIPTTIGDRRRGRPSLRTLARLRRRVRTADVVHTHLFAGDVWGRLVAFDHPRVIATAHNIDVDEAPRHRAARRLTAPVARLTVAVSEAVARAVPDARDIRVIENGVDLARFGAHHGGAGVLAVGRIAPQKGYDVLLDALPAGAPLRVAGAGTPPREQPGVTWLGPRDDVPALLAAADVFVMPSRWEGFGLAAVEAMAAGVPVVVSDTGGLAEVVGDAGLRVPPGDVDALRGALVRVLGDAELRADLAARGRARAQRYDVGTMVRRYEALYRRLAAPTAA